MNFNSTSILSLEGDNLTNNRAFIKLINNLPIKEKDGAGKLVNGRVMPTYYSLLFVPASSSKGWLGVVSKILKSLFIFKHTNQPLHKGWFK